MTTRPDHTRPPAYARDRDGRRRREHELPAAARRLGAVTLVLLRYACADLASRAIARAPWLRRIPGSARVTHASGPERLRDLFQALGGAFLKFGQMLALQPDVLPIRYCNALFDLLDRVPAFPFADVDRIFVEDLGRPSAAVFDAIDPVPLASASIGQVHVATLAGRRVAVKVQRPTARAQFTNDTRLMTLLIRAIRRTHCRPLYWLIEPLTEFVWWTGEELDYRCEARAMQRLRRHAEDNRFERVPEVLWPYVTRRILVADFLDGDTVLAYLRRRESAGGRASAPAAARGFDPHALASHIIDNFLGDAFQNGIFHADLHPANLVILPDNVVGYVDFGITGTISRYSRQNLIALTLAYTRGDLAGMCAAFFCVSAIDEASSVERFRAGLDTASQQWYADGAGGRRLRKNFTLVMLDMLRLSRETAIWPERDVIRYIRSAIAMDGLITRLAPTFDVRRHLEDVCARYMASHVPRAAAIAEAIATGMSSGLRVLRTGGARTSTILARLASGDLPVTLDMDPPPRRTARPRAVVAAAGVIAIAVAVAGAPGAGADAAVGIATAQVSIVACLVALLARGSRRDARTRTRT